MSSASTQSCSSGTACRDNHHTNLCYNIQLEVGSWKFLVELQRGSPPFWSAQNMLCDSDSKNSFNFGIWESRWMRLRKNCQWPWPLYMCFSSSTIVWCPFTHILPSFGGISSLFCWKTIYDIISWKLSKIYKIDLFCMISRIPLSIRLEKFLYIWNLEAKVKVIKVNGNFDLDDVMTLKPSIFFLAI